jgi:hypothetical protein
MFSTADLKFPHPLQRVRLREFQIESGAIAFSSEVDAGSRKENAPKQQSRASLLIQSEAKCSGIIKLLILFACRSS